MCVVCMHATSGEPAFALLQLVRAKGSHIRLLRDRVMNAKVGGVEVRVVLFSIGTSGLTFV